MQNFREMAQFWSHTILPQFHADIIPLPLVYRQRIEKIDVKVFTFNTMLVHSFISHAINLSYRLFQSLFSSQSCIFTLPQICRHGYLNPLRLYILTYIVPSP